MVSCSAWPCELMGRCSPCEEAAKASYKCLDRFDYDRDKCTDFFQAYRDCKKSWVRGLRLCVIVRALTLVSYMYRRWSSERRTRGLAVRYLDTTSLFKYAFSANTVFPADGSSRSSGNVVAAETESSLPPYSASTTVRKIRSMLLHSGHSCHEPTEEVILIASVPKAILVSVA